LEQNCDSATFAKILPGMNLNDLLPYFELYKNLQDSGKETLLNEKLAAKEKEFVGKEITVLGVVNEIDLQKKEIILTYRSKDGSDPLLRLISNHFFIFSISDEIPELVKEFNIEKDDLVEVNGEIISIHRQSVLRIALSSVTIQEKNFGLTRSTRKKGCFIATAVYGGESSWQVQRFYRLRDDVLNRSLPGRLFVQFYYFVSPALARWVEDKPGIKSFIRKRILDRILERF
jgi:hypothetical protein